MVTVTKTENITLVTMLDLFWGRVDGSMIDINELSQTNVQISERDQVPWSGGRNKRTHRIHVREVNGYIWSSKQFSFKVINEKQIPKYLWGSDNVMDVTARRSIPSVNGVKTELHILRKGTVNGGAVSKWPRCRWDLKHNQPTQLPIVLWPWSSEFLFAQGAFPLMHFSSRAARHFFRYNAFSMKRLAGRPHQWKCFIENAL